MQSYIVEYEMNGSVVILTGEEQRCRADDLVYDALSCSIPGLPIIVSTAGVSSKGAYLRQAGVKVLSVVWLER
jgi:hypothetical protein